MRKVGILLLISLLTVFSIYAEQIKLLAIGNSFSDDAIEHYLHGLAEANGDTIIIGNMYIGGSSLELHYNNSQNNSNSYSYRKIVNGVKTETPDFRLTDAIADEDWDYISFQQVSSLSGMYETYFPYLDELLKFAKKHSTNGEVEFILHSTWAYAHSSTHPGFSNYNNYQAEMYNAIIDASARATEKAGINIVIPAGTAIQNGRTSSLGDTFCRDGYHLELTYGRYTASCAWYEKLFGNSVLGNSYVPFTIDPFQAKVAQLAAHTAVINPTSITPIRINESAWRTIEPYFNTPKEYENTLHGYRSPLQFYDGTPVKDKNDWTERRKEIRETWMGMMGEWPAILEDQELEIIDQDKREDFTQYTVRFKWTPNEYTVGYLLIPDKEGKKPAVITVFYQPETAIGYDDKENRDFAYQLTKRGFVTFSIGTTLTTENRTYSIYYPDIDNSEIQPLELLT